MTTSTEAGRQGHENYPDTHMTSSPFLSSSVLPENIAESQGTCMVMSLAREENLEGEFFYLWKVVVTSSCRFCMLMALTSDQGKIPTYIYGAHI